MDIVTQGLLGAITAQSASTRQQLRVATAVGFAAALLPDADVLIRSDADPLLVLEYHRHFSHSLVFIPIGALIASLLLWPLLRRTMPWRSVYGYAFLGYATAGLLDACTSYGTRLLWPFDNTAVAWSIISVVDPVFSLLLVVALVLGWRLHNRRWAWLGLGLAAGYLALGVVQHQRALEVAENLAAERGLSAQRVLVKPTMGNLLLWRAIAVVDDNKAYIDAVRIGLGSDAKVYPGEIKALVDPDSWQDLPRESRAYRELVRFRGYSDNLLAEHPNDPRFIGDLRYAMLPNGTVPLWGIVLDPDRPDGPIDFTARREFTPQTRRRFLDMLWGE